jgi:HSP20 family protein
MSNLTRWEPMRDMVTLRDAMNRLFDEAFTRPWGSRDGVGGISAPAVDMYQTENDVVVKAAVPGMKADDMQINVTGDLLALKGEIREKNELKDKAYHIREQRWGSFERNIPPSTLIMADRGKAEFEDGVLTITLPKAEEVKPKTISVKAK